MGELEPRRLALFLAVAAALLASALAFAIGGDSAGQAANAARRPPPSTGLPPVARRTVRWARSMASGARRAARRFLSVFASYEVGRLAPSVSAGLRATATPRFTARLLAAPPAPPAVGARAGAARLGKLDVTFVSGRATRALISGVLRRGGAPEQVSFLFERRRGRWLASGPGE